MAEKGAQLFLYKALGFEPPAFCHIPLLVAPDGRRLSKRNRDLDMGALRSRLSSEAVIGCVMFLCGFIPKSEPMPLNAALCAFSMERLPLVDIVVPLEL